MKQADHTDGRDAGRVGARTPLLDTQKVGDPVTAPMAPPVFIVQMRRLASRSGTLALHARLVVRQNGKMSPPRTSRSVCQVKDCPYTACLPGIDVAHGDPAAPTQHLVLLCDAHRIESNRTRSQTWLEDNIPSFGS
jgi:hypothetical protein